MKLGILLSPLFLTLGAGAQALELPSSPAGPEVEQNEPIRFPLKLEPSGVMSGQAWIVVGVDGQGKLEDTLVIGYTRHEFADVALAAMKKWKFKPLLIDGRPRSIVQEWHFNFSRTGVLVNRLVVDSTGPWTNRREDERLDFRLRVASELDHLPVPIKATAPIFPQALATRPGTRSVIVEFYIDETGAVRLPAVLTTGEPELGHLAVEAVRTWQFEPPMSRGKRVLVVVRQVFHFLNQ